MSRCVTFTKGCMCLDTLATTALRKGLGTNVKLWHINHDWKEFGLIYLKIQPNEVML